MLKNNIIECIGSTPLLHLNDTNIYAKLEYFNPLHSVKDRAALFMIRVLWKGVNSNKVVQ